GDVKAVWPRHLRDLKQRRDLFSYVVEQSRVCSVDQFSVPLHPRQIPHLIRKNHTGDTKTASNGDLKRITLGAARDWATHK
ncbi:MAG: hypothetical protein WA889_04325, partial [Xanthobacteraceae bacterium]